MSKMLLTVADIEELKANRTESFRNINVAGYWLKHIQPKIVEAANMGLGGAHMFNLPPFFIHELYEYGKKIRI